jgi:hypothetical protein
VIARETPRVARNDSREKLVMTAEKLVIARETRDGPQEKLVMTVRALVATAREARDDSEISW